MSALWNWLKTIFANVKYIPPPAAIASVVPPPPITPPLPPPTDPLALKYQSAKINPDKLASVKSIGGKIMIHQGQYQKVQNATGVPWYVVASIHYRESDLDFTCHLHNGDPLTARTYHVPAGRPVNGDPPFAWYESAIDALGVHKGVTWDIPYCLNYLEEYNGLGYKHRGLPSPYVWSFTDQYSKGKYIADGVFDPNKVDQQCGCVAIMKILGAS